MSGGANPRGAAGEQEAARWVRGMFARVAHRYDTANHLLSFNADRYWRRRTVRAVEAVLRRPEARVLDLCCGTGDLAMALDARRGAPVFGSDFCHPMLTAARAKAGKRRLAARWFEADALQLPVADGSFDLVTVAFGFRNLANYQRGLEEMRRVLRPGGVAAILEFSQPPNPVFRAFYDWYSLRILPAVGGMLSGARDAYTYLPDSVRQFPGADELARRMEASGFGNVRYERLTFGIVALHLGDVTG
ncbi:MAG: bifunctional demethylmenaquinone methyltransferase/2-methoxy-6-polyprenyl-1,4-benzoquinol methylase UbiE [Bryobacterales bacterium]|nr:bifunctional demethylmenaquinone methyltransferase/2-methoxy-6-polyprenyl-1,4-benzoquinol methylase UbiE [Bryobacterales bacterium]